mgnify:CR=1 FL=1
MSAEEYLDGLCVLTLAIKVRNQTHELQMNINEDSNISTDANFVMNGSGAIVEVQASAEKNLFTRNEFDCLFDLAESGIKDLFLVQNSALCL